MGKKDPAGQRGAQLCPPGAVCVLPERPMNVVPNSEQNSVNSAWREKGIDAIIPIWNARVPGPADAQHLE